MSCRFDPGSGYKVNLLQNSRLFFCAGVFLRLPRSGTFYYYNKERRLFGAGERVDDQPVGPIDGGGVERSQVDPRRGFRVVAHAFADDRERDLLAAGDAGPGVARDIERQGRFEPDLSAQRFQPAVDPIADVLYWPCSLPGVRMIGSRYSVPALGWRSTISCMHGSQRMASGCPVFCRR